MSRRRLATARSAHREPAVDTGRWQSQPTPTIAHMTKLANLGAAP